MLDVILLRSALSAFSTLFGSLGVFFDYMSFIRPSLGMHAILCLAAAMAILRWTEQK